MPTLAALPEQGRLEQKSPGGSLSRTARTEIFRLLRPYLYIEKEVKAIEVDLHQPEGSFEEKKLRLFLNLEKLLDLLEQVSMPRLLVSLKKKKGDCHFYCHDIPEALYEYRRAVRPQLLPAETHCQGRSLLPGAGCPVQVDGTLSARAEAAREGHGVLQEAVADLLVHILGTVQGLPFARSRTRLVR